MNRRRVVLGGLLGALFALGWWAGGTRAASGLYSGLDLFVEVLLAVQANYVDPVDPGKLVTGAMRGVTRSLDPWSRYLDPDEFRATRGVIQGSFDGIGATVDQKGGWPVIVAPIEGSPAWEAGLEPGDVVTKVDGHSMFGLTPDEVGAKLRGGPATFVTLTVARADQEHEIKLQREKVQVKNVPYSFLATPGVATSGSPTSRRTRRPTWPRRAIRCAPRVRARWCWTCAATRAARSTRRWRSRPSSCPTAPRS